MGKGDRVRWVKNGAGGRRDVLMPYEAASSVGAAIARGSTAARMQRSFIVDC